MTGRIINIKRFAVHDGDGIRTTVFFKGCPLKCLWCHNPESRAFEKELAYYEHKCVNCGLCDKVCKANFYNKKHIFDRNECVVCDKCKDVCPNEALKIYGEDVTVEWLLKKVLEDKIFYENSGGGVTISGGECLVQVDFCAEFLRLCKLNGLNTAIDTCGYVDKQAFDKVIPHTDVFLYDLKAFDEDVHVKCTGFSNQIILDNLIYLNDKGCKVEIRIPLVPEYNDNQVEKLAEFIAPLKNITKVKILPVHNFTDAKLKALGKKATKQFKTPTIEQLKIAKNILENKGITVVVD